MAEYWKIKKKFTGGRSGHCTNDDEYAVEFALTINRTDNNSTIIDDCFCISDKLLGSYTHYFFDKGIIFLTENGCIRPLVDTEYSIIKTKNKNTLIWPSLKKYTKKDIHIIKWPGGKHYYVKIRNIYLEDKNGKQKWNTITEAERQANLFLKRINKKL